MRSLAPAIAATLVLAAVSPAFAEDASQAPARVVEPTLAVTFTGTSTPAGTAVVGLVYAYVELLNYPATSWQIGFAPFTLGRIGLLFDADPTGGHVKADLLGGEWSLTGAVVRGGAPPPAPDVLWMFRAETNIADGLVGLNYLGEVAAGAWSSGWAADLSREILPGVSLDGEYASFAPAGGTAATAYEAGLTLNLDAVFGWEPLSPSLTLAYREADPAFVPAPPAFTSADDWRGWSADLGLTLSPSLDATITFESGTDIDTGGARSGVVVEFISPLAANMELTITYTFATVGGVEVENQTEVKLFYQWP